MAPKYTPDEYQKTINNLKEQLEDYRVLVENSPDLLYRTDNEGRITFISSSVLKLSGYSVEEAIGMKMDEEVYRYPKDRQKFLDILNKAGRVYNFRAQLKRKDGSTWWASTNAHFYKDRDGQIKGVEGVTRDVSNLKKAEKALEESEELFRLAFHTSPDAINVNRLSDGVFIDINEGFSKIMGYKREEVIGKSSLGLDVWCNPEERDRLVQVLKRQGYIDNLEAEFKGKDGRIRIGLMSARVMQIKNEHVILSIARDITDRKQLEQQLQQAQKFEALGTLAGGIAHDFNNLLMGIQGRASLMEVNLSKNDPLYEHVQGIEEYVQSAANLTQQLLGLTRSGKYEITPLDINELLRKNATMFGRTRKEISLHVETAAEKIIVEADKQQIEQVLLNLFVNSWQAMPGGGDLLLKTSTLYIDESFSDTHQISPGYYGKIEVTDTGIGMDKETRNRAFDPFFTTKEIGRGTGLGLASAFGIIKHHGGVITIYSEKGQGTTITIYLPLSTQEARQEIPVENGLLKGSETILLVDDEALVIDVGKAMLEMLGYSVKIATSGAEALNILSLNNEFIDLIILDLIMPGMDGGKTFEGMRQIRTDIPILLSSGYSLNGQVSEILQQGCNGFIQKPFTIVELSKKIRTIFDR